MGDTFLDGYIALAEGEKDPRNLLVAFAIARVLLIEFEIARHVEVRRILSFTFEWCCNMGAAIVQHHFLLLPHHVQATA